VLTLSDPVRSLGAGQTGRSVISAIGQFQTVEARAAKSLQTRRSWLSVEIVRAVRRETDVFDGREGD